MPSPQLEVFARGGCYKDFSRLIETQTQPAPLDADHTGLSWTDHSDVAAYLNPYLLQPLEVAWIPTHVNNHPVVFGVEEIDGNRIRRHVLRPQITRSWAG